MAEDENENRFAHKDMLLAGLDWLKENTNFVTLNTGVPSSAADARGGMIAGGAVTSEDFVGPEFVDPEEAEAHPLEKGDVVLYLAVKVMQGLFDGAATSVCLLGEGGILYMAPVAGIDIVEGRPASLGVWCISGLQPTEDCEVNG